MIPDHPPTKHQTLISLDSTRRSIGYSSPGALLALLVGDETGNLEQVPVDQYGANEPTGIHQSFVFYNV